MRNNTDELRQLVAEEAARLIYEEGFKDYRVAKLKAAEQLGVFNQHAAQPSNEQIEEAIHQRIRLFDADTHPQLLKQHRQVALEAMEFLEAYKPYLTGAALEGTSSEHSAVTLLLGADSVEEVMFFLEDQHIPFETFERKLKFSSKPAEYFPLLRFFVDEVEVELMVLPFEDRFASAPISPITGKAMRRADLKRVRSLLDQA